MTAPNSSALGDEVPTFLGQPVGYWIELKKEVELNNGDVPAYDRLLLENAKLRACLTAFHRAASDIKTLEQSYASSL